MTNLTIFTITPEGLRIELNDSPSAKEEIIEIKEKFESGKWSYPQAFWELCESPLCNGYSEVRDEHKGLTEAPMISDGIVDDETTEEEMERTNIWAFTDYMVRDELRELFEKGFVIFPLIQKSKS